jgi:ribosome recycling factor
MRAYITTQTPQIRVGINNQSRKSVRSVSISVLANGTKLADLADVDVSGSENNEVLVYDSALEKYVIKSLPVLDGGQY